MTPCVRTRSCLEWSLLEVPTAEWALSRRVAGKPEPNFRWHAKGGITKGGIAWKRFWCIFAQFCCKFVPFFRPFQNAQKCTKTRHFAQTHATPPFITPPLACTQNFLPEPQCSGHQVSDDGSMFSTPLSCGLKCPNRQRFQIQPARDLKSQQFKSLRLQLRFLPV